MKELTRDILLSNEDLSGNSTATIRGKTGSQT
jgi:hypothetical protein